MNIIKVSLGQSKKNFKNTEQSTLVVIVVVVAVAAAAAAAAKLRHSESERHFITTSFPESLSRTTSLLERADTA